MIICRNYEYLEKLVKVSLFLLWAYYWLTSWILGLIIGILVHILKKNGLERKGAKALLSAQSKLCY